VVRLTAAKCLGDSVDEWDSDVETLLPFVPNLFEKIMALIDEVEETETKMSLVNVVSMIVVQLEHRVFFFSSFFSPSPDKE